MICVLCIILLCLLVILAPFFVFEVELTDLILAMEFTARFNWRKIWLESDSTSSVLAFKNSDIIPFLLQNRWHICFQLDIIIVVSSHIYHKGNYCANKLASHGHALYGLAWFEAMPSFLGTDFSRDRNSLCNYRFP